MKKVLEKKQNRNIKTLNLYSTPCSCSLQCAGCGSVPSNDYFNVKANADYEAMRDDHWKS